VRSFTLGRDFPRAPHRVATRVRNLWPAWRCMLLLLLLVYPAGHAFAEGSPPYKTLPPEEQDEKSHQRAPDIGYFYTLQPGDTLWDIAAAHGLTVDALTAANASANLKYFQPGQTIFVPARQANVPRPKPRPTPVPPPAAPPPPPPPAPAPDAAAAAPPPAAPAEPAPAPAAPSDAQPNTDQALLLQLINAQRGAHGLPALTWSPELAAAAQGHAADCAKRGFGSHVGSDGAYLRVRLARAGFNARNSSENWAYVRSAEGAYSMWWNEPPGGPHRRNILDAAYREIGIGQAVGGWGFIYFVADFGTR
jgi:uncharacterized protein YkwD